MEHRFLPRPDQVRLVHLLIDELARDESELLSLASGPHTVWFPEDNSAAAATLQRLLEQERDVP